MERQLQTLRLERRTAAFGADMLIVTPIGSVFFVDERVVGKSLDNAAGRQISDGI